MYATISSIDLIVLVIWLSKRSVSPHMMGEDWALLQQNNNFGRRGENCWLTSNSTVYLLKTSTFHADCEIRYLCLKKAVREKRVVHDHCMMCSYMFKNFSE